MKSQYIPLWTTPLVGALLTFLFGWFLAVLCLIADLLMLGTGQVLNMVGLGGDKLFAISGKMMSVVFGEGYFWGAVFLFFAATTLYFFAQVSFYKIQEAKCVS